MDLPEKIAELDAREVREMFKNFLEREIEVEWKDGLPVRHIRRMTSSVIEAELGVPPADAEQIQAKLIAEGYLEPEKLTPTRLGMALAQHSDRAKISRADAEAILTQVLDWADRTNAVAAARVKVKTIHLYGSLERGAEQVGDVDLFIEFTTMDLGLDLTPEDQQREWELSEELVAISEYLSPSSFIDRMLMDDVPMRRVFPR